MVFSEFMEAIEDITQADKEYAIMTIISGIDGAREIIKRNLVAKTNNTLRITLENAICNIGQVKAVNEEHDIRPGGEMMGKRSFENG